MNVREVGAVHLKQGLTHPLSGNVFVQVLCKPFLISILYINYIHIIY